MHILWKLLRILVGIIAALIIILVLLAVIPPRAVSFTPSAPLCKNYAESMTRFNEILKKTPADVRDICRPFVLTHDAPTPEVFVLLHGLTNCPQQFRKFAEILHAQGHNVVVPLTPYHGNENRLTDELRHLTPQDLLSSADEALAIAHGLGQRVTIMGLSVNGATVAWYAQNTKLADRAVLLAPFTGINGIPIQYQPYVDNLLSRLPNMFFWWNPKLKENIPGPPYAYPRAASKPIAEILLFAQQVLEEAQKTPPQTKNILVVTSDSDTVINHQLVNDLIAAWQQSEKIEVYQFPLQEKVPHDMIDPTQPNQQVDIVYPQLLKLLNP